MSGLSRVLRVVEEQCTEDTAPRHSCSSKTTFFNWGFSLKNGLEL